MISNNNSTNNATNKCLYGYDYEYDYVNCCFSWPGTSPDDSNITIIIINDHSNSDNSNHVIVATVIGDNSNSAGGLRSTVFVVARHLANCYN